METAKSANTEPATQVVYEVDPSRFQSGTWSERRQKTIGRGDIVGAYSADKIAFDEPVRRPFKWQGAGWIAVSIDYRDSTVEAHKLVAPGAFQGTPVTYAKKVGRDGEAARHDPRGFYHGMLVKRGSGFVVVSGPATFKMGAKRQLDLFG